MRKMKKGADVIIVSTSGTKLRSIYNTHNASETQLPFSRFSKFTEVCFLIDYH